MITPHTTAGRVIAIVVMFVGIGTATLVIGAIAQRGARPGGGAPPGAPARAPAAAAASEVAERLEALAAQLSRSHGELTELLRELDRRLGGP